MSMASGRIVLRVGKIEISDDNYIPKIIAPIPSKPDEITLERASLDSFDKFEEKIQSFFEQANDAEHSLDILVYSKTVMDNFSNFIWKVSDETKYKGTKITLTEEDIVGDITL